jgi:type II secretory pathway component PulC
MEVSKLELRRVIKNFNLLNCILIAAVLVFTFSLLLPQRDSNPAIVLPSLKKKPVEKTQGEPPKAQNPSPMDYVVVADENLFHPERKIPPEKKAEAVLPKPEFVLFGTLISPNLSMAYMEDKKAPVTTPGRGNRQTTLKKGETLSGFTLKEIMKDRVVMARGEETIQVPLEDPGSPKKRETLLATPGPHPQPPGISAPIPQPQSPQMGQTTRQPISRRQAFPPGGMPTAPSPMPTAPSPMPTAPSPMPTAPSPMPIAPSPTPTAPSPTPTAPSPKPSVPGGGGTVPVFPSR